MRIRRRRNGGRKIERERIRGGRRRLKGVIP